MNKKLFFIPLLIFIVISSIFFYVLITERNPSEIPSNLINKKTPQFEAESLLKSTKFISSNEFVNELILVNFFATWCKPCRDEHIYLQLFSKEKKLKIVGINYKDNPKNTLEWLTNLGNPYSNIPIDKDGMIAIDWGVYGIPETFIVNKDGIIKYRHIGPITEKNYKKISLLIDEIKNEK